MTTAEATPTQPGYQTVKEIASKLAVSPRTIYRMVKSKTIPHLRVRGSLRFSSAAIDRWERTKSTR